MPHLDTPRRNNEDSQVEIPIISVARFEGDLRALVTEWKFRRRTLLTRHLAGMVVDALVDQGKSTKVDVVTWAPTSDHRRRTRGYDQAELLATCVARRLRVPCRRLLLRNGGKSQTGRNRLDRLVDGPSFRARPVRVPLRVLVVDDVVTTGSTLRSAGRALVAAGHRDVILIALGSTPLAAGKSRIGRATRIGGKPEDSPDSEV